MLRISFLFDPCSGEKINLFDGPIMLRICLFYILKFGGMGSSTKFTTVSLTFHHPKWEINQNLVFWQMIASILTVVTFFFLERGIKQQ